MRDVRRSAVVICVLFAGCSGDAGQPHRESAVTGKVDLDNPRAATTSSAVFTFSGKVSPPDSKVSVSDGTVRVEPSGRFTVAVASPRAGSKQVKLAATNPGSRSWRLNVRVARAPTQASQGAGTRCVGADRRTAPRAGRGRAAERSGLTIARRRRAGRGDAVRAVLPCDGGGPRRRGRHRPHSPCDGGDHAVRQHGATNRPSAATGPDREDCHSTGGVGARRARALGAISPRRPPGLQRPRRGPSRGHRCPRTSGGHTPRRIQISRSTTAMSDRYEMMGRRYAACSTCVRTSRSAPGWRWA